MSHSLSLSPSFFRHRRSPFVCGAGAQSPGAPMKLMWIQRFLSLPLRAVSGFRLHARAVGREVYIYAFSPFVLREGEIFACAAHGGSCGGGR